MKPLIDFLEAHPTTYVAIIAPLLALVTKRGRALVGCMLTRIGAGKRAFNAKLDKILIEVSEIKSEVQFSNDTSLKQQVSLLQKRSHLDFWMKNKPSIEMDGSAQVLHVSETLCRLMGVWTPADLYLRNWLRCVESGRVDEFLSSFVETVKFRSDFDFVFKIQTKDGTDQGTWKLIMSDVTPPGFSKTIYSGYFRPVDVRAKEVAESIHWSR